MERRRWHCQAVLLGVIAFCLPGCFRHVRLDPDEATKLSSPEHPPKRLIVVRTQRGELRSLDDFDSVIVRWHEPCGKPETCRRHADKYKPPLSAVAQFGDLTITDARQNRQYSERAVDAVVVRQFAPERTGIVLGVALATAALVGWSTALLMPADSDLTVIPVVSAFIAGPLTLPLTLKWTQPLGEPVNDSR